MWLIVGLLILAGSSQSEQVPFSGHQCQPWRFELEAERVRKEAVAGYLSLEVRPSFGIPALISLVFEREDWNARQDIPVQVASFPGGEPHEQVLELQRQTPLLDDVSACRKVPLEVRRRVVTGRKGNKLRRLAVELANAEMPVQLPSLIVLDGVTYKIELRKDGRHVEFEWHAETHDETREIEGILSKLLDAVSEKLYPMHHDFLAIRSEPAFRGF